MNGVFSMIKYGLNQCFGGFGPESVDCDELDLGDVEDSLGWLAYEPSDESPEANVSKLVTLMTA
jgi:hypothetical protein